MTHHLFAAWPDIARQIARAGVAAFFTDFDGTLAPIRRDARRVQLAEPVRRALARLADRGLIVGVVSGRAIGDVRARVGVDGIWYVGDHGFLLRDPRHRTVKLVTSRERARIAGVTRQLRRALGHVAGITVEHKGATVAVHYRNARAGNQHLAAEAVRRTIGRRRGLRLMHGKKVWEILPAGHVDKSTAIRRILRAERRRGSVRLKIYVGDDIADERVFATWNGLSVAVGHQPHTAARYYLRSPLEVHAFLRRLERALDNGPHHAR